MNWLKKGPDLKLSGLKVPGFVRDLFKDMKDRHLLPVMAILIVALVAVPLILKSSDNSSEEVTASPTIATASSAGGEASLAVTRSTPGLLDPAHRLKHATPVDPFAQKVAAGAEEGESSQETSESSTGGELGSEATVIGGQSEAESAAGAVPIEVPAESGSTGSHESGSSGGNAPVQTKYASNVIDVRIVTLPVPSTNDATKAKSKSKAKPEVEVRREVPELTMLPARSIPVATYMGTSRDGKKALMLVSSDVISLFGEGVCVVGSEACQLIALEAGMPETIVYGPQERRYRIQVLKISQSLGSKPLRATLGSGDGGKQKAHESGESGSEKEAGTAPTERGSEEHPAAG
jgi:hypothetical protein